MAKDIKVIFNGTKTPSGKVTGVEYFVGEAALNKWQNSKMFDIEIIENSKPKATPAPKKKKSAKKESE